MWVEACSRSGTEKEQSWQFLDLQCWEAQGNNWGYLLIFLFLTSSIIDDANICLVWATLKHQLAVLCVRARVRLCVLRCFVLRPPPLPVP